MKTQPRQRNQSRHILCGFVAGLLLLPATLFAQTSTTDWSIALLDQILTNVQPGQKTARIDDMDILVSNLQAWRNKLAGLPSPMSAFYGGATPWTGGNMYYTFDPTVTVAKQKVFLDCAAEWSLFANLHFILRTGQTNYMTVVQRTDPPDTGGSSNVGMIGGQQFLWLGTNAFNHRVICHELGHTLGLAHEQQRSDRDSYITIITKNVAPTNMVMFTILTDFRNQGPYDFLSIMHYGWNAGAFSPNLPTMVPLPPYSQFAYILGQGDPILTPYDRAGMALRAECENEAAD